jgi:hypothetical protein
MFTNWNQMIPSEVHAINERNIFSEVLFQFRCAGGRTKAKFAKSVGKWWEKFESFGFIFCHDLLLICLAPRMCDNRIIPAGSRALYLLTFASCFLYYCTLFWNNLNLHEKHKNKLYFVSFKICESFVLKKTEKCNSCNLWYALQVFLVTTVTAHMYAGPVLTLLVVTWMKKTINKKLILIVKI